MIRTSGLTARARMAELERFATTAKPRKKPIDSGGSLRSSVVMDAVQSEPVSALVSLLTGKIVIFG